MTERPVTPPVLPGYATAPSIERTLRRLFLTLFLRGRSSRGLRKGSAPKSVGSKLTLTLLFYAVFGFLAIGLQNQPVFALSVYLHAMTFIFLGMFVASSAGEVLFNKEEAEILMHRPVPAGTLLWAKIAVLVQISLWLAGAFNLVGFGVGVVCPNGGWLFPLAHILSTALEALFCTGCVVMVYQLCLRWFGRERLDTLMTTTQVLIAICAVTAGQLAPHLFARMGGKISFDTHSVWLAFLPPTWFAGLDDAIAGQRAASSWILGAVGLAATALVLWIAFVKLARNYELGVQSLGETVSAKPRQRSGRRWFQKLVEAPPLNWWLRDSVSRAAFLLTAAYLVRDRDVKLRIYPGLAPLLVMPFVFLIQDSGGHSSFGGSGFGIAFAGAYLGLTPMLALNLLRYSQQWQASDIFRVAPITGPAPLCHGTRRAVLCLLALPMLLFFTGVTLLLRHHASHLALLVPGVIALPVYALIPCLSGKAVPFSLPTEEAKSAGRGLSMVGVMFVSMALGGLATWAWSAGWFGWFLLGETVIMVTLYITLRASMRSLRWTPLE